MPKNIRKNNTNDTTQHQHHHHNSTTIAIAKHQIHEFNMSLPFNPESYRTSCDRCRLQKLRCVSSFDSDWPSACQRCTRARVPCVYGRRARSGRRPKKPDNLNEEVEEGEEGEEGEGPQARAGPRRPALPVGHRPACGPHPARHQPSQRRLAVRVDHRLR